MLTHIHQAPLYIPPFSLEWCLHWSQQLRIFSSACRCRDAAIWIEGWSSKPARMAMAPHDHYLACMTWACPWWHVWLILWNHNTLEYVSKTCCLTLRLRCTVNVPLPTFIHVAQTSSAPLPLRSPGKEENWVPTSGAFPRSSWTVLNRITLPTNSTAECGGSHHRGCLHNRDPLHTQNLWLPIYWPTSFTKATDPIPRRPQPLISSLVCNSTEALGSRVSLASTTCPAWEGRLVVSTIMNINHGINHDNRHLQAGATMMIKMTGVLCIQMLMSWVWSQNNMV